MKTYIVTIRFLFLFIDTAFAVPPPDFIFQAASYIASFFAISSAFFGAVFFSLYNIFKTYLRKYKRYIIIGGSICILLLAGIVSYFLDIYYQGVQKDEIYSIIENNTGVGEISTTGTYQDNTTKANSKKSEKKESTKNIESTEIVYIREIYNTDISTQYEIFSLRDVTKSDQENEFTVDFIITENNVSIRYRDLIILQKDEKNIPRDYVVITRKIIQRKDLVQDDISINNEFLQKVIQDDENKSIILDARETIEYGYGHMKDVVHIRMADIFEGRWTELDGDTPIYVMCWSGIRGKEVATFLREKGLDAYYVKDGADGWVSGGGERLGSIKFLENYTTENYKRVFNTSDMKNFLHEGVTVIDARDQASFEKNGIEKSTFFDLRISTTQEIEKFVESLGSSNRYIVTCDGYVNCFYAKILGVYIEQSGNTFLGRFTELDTL